jgi:hypothetical protein
MAKRKNDHLTCPLGLYQLNILARTARIWGAYGVRLSMGDASPTESVQDGGVLPGNLAQMAACCQKATIYGINRQLAPSVWEGEHAVHNQMFFLPPTPATCWR